MKPKQKRTIAAGLAATSVLGSAAMMSRGGAEPEVMAGTSPSEAEDNASAMRYGAVVGSEWDMPVTKNDRVDFFIEFLMTKKKDKMHLWLERLGAYAPMIQAELRERGMPEDLVFLAMMESGLDNDAYSCADADGRIRLANLETGASTDASACRIVIDEIDDRQLPDAVRVHGRFEAATDPSSPFASSRVRGAFVADLVRGS